MARAAIAFVAHGDCEKAANAALNAARWGGLAQRAADAAGFTAPALGHNLRDAQDRAQGALQSVANACFRAPPVASEATGGARKRRGVLEF